MRYTTQYKQEFVVAEGTAKIQLTAGSRGHFAYN